jgi:hypothetical protein
MSERDRKVAEEEKRIGIFEMGGGLLPSSQGHKVTMAGGKVTVLEGPITQTKEVIGGFSILNYFSHELAIEGAKHVLKIHADAGVTDLEIEIRPMFDPHCTNRDSHKNALIILAVISVSFVGILAFAATKPDVFAVQRMASIKATPENIFPFVNDFRQWTISRHEAQLRRDHGRLG